MRGWARGAKRGGTQRRDGGWCEGGRLADCDVSVRHTDKHPTCLPPPARHAHTPHIATSDPGPAVWANLLVPFARLRAPPCQYLNILVTGVSERSCMGAIEVSARARARGALIKSSKLARQKKHSVPARAKRTWGRA